MAAQLRVAKLYLNKPQDFWNNVLWTEDTKVMSTGHNTASCWVAQTPHTSTVVDG